MQAVDVGDADPAESAVTVSGLRFTDAADGAATSGFAQPRRAAEHVVLSRDDVFADSLTGTVLTHDGPMLLTDPAVLTPTTAAEIDRVLPPGGTVVLLGGESALAPSIEAAVVGLGYDVVRIAGPSRVETAVAVAQTAVDRYGVPAQVAVARADAPPDQPTAAWADSVTAGAWAARTTAPILLTASADVHPAVQAWLDAYPQAQPLVLGGEAAISPAVATQVGAVDRVAGSNRFATAADVAAAMFTESPAGYLVLNGADTTGWAFALPAAGLAADTGHPILLVEAGRLPDETAAATCRAGARAEVAVIGGPGMVGQAVRDALTVPCP